MLHIKSATHTFKCVCLVLSHEVNVLRKVCITFFSYPTTRMDYS